MITEQEEDTKYFFKTRININTKIFDIKEYLIVLGSENTLIIKEYREKYGCIEEEYVKEWIDALVPYFKTNKSTEQLKLSTQNEIYLEQKSDVNNLNYLEESKENWTGEPRVLVAFLECLKMIKEYENIESRLNKIFPMICQVIDDYRSQFKIKGVELLKEFMRIVPSEVMIKFNLHLVIYESLKVNVTFESDELIKISLDSWIKLIEIVEIFGNKDFLKRVDELLLLLCRDVGITSKINRKVILLNCIGMVVELMQYCSIRYLRKVTVTLCESVREDFTSDEVVRAGEEAMIFVIKNCWIRMKSSDEIQKLVLDTFDGCKTVESLLKMVRNA